MILAIVFALLQILSFILHGDDSNCRPVPRVKHI
jgi:hypothetical protein